MISLNKKIIYILKHIQFKKHLITLIITSSIMFIILYIVITSTAITYLKEIQEKYEYRVDKHLDSNNDIIDINYFCQTFLCSKIVHESEIRHYKVSILFKILTFYIEPLYINIKFGDYYAIYNLKIYQDTVYTILINSFISLVLLVIIFKTIIAYYSYSKLLISRQLGDNIIITKLQKELTESLHHELGLPMAIIKTKCMELITDFESTLNVIVKLIKKDGKRSIDTIYDDLFTVIPKNINTIKQQLLLSIDSVNSVLDMIAINKNIKANNVQPLLVLIENSLKMYTTFQVKKINYLIHEKTILKSYKLNNQLKSSIFNNMLVILTNNAVEAGATLINITTNINNKNNNISKLHLYFSDNGSGIRIKNYNKIFDYGISTKIKNRSCKFMDWFINIFDFSHSSVGDTSRGCGLAIMKTILISIGGDIKVYDTSKKGTTFEIILPVTKIKD